MIKLPVNSVSAIRKKISKAEKTIIWFYHGTTYAQYQLPKHYNCRCSVKLLTKDDL